MTIKNETVMIKRNSEVMLRKTSRSGDLVVSKGSVLKMTAADYEGDFELYQLEGVIYHEGKRLEVSIWTYRDSFEVLTN